jgi:hypothetical protein
MVFEKQIEAHRKFLSEQCGTARRDSDSMPGGETKVNGDLAVDSGEGKR